MLTKNTITANLMLYIAYEELTPSLIFLVIVIFVILLYIAYEELTLIAVIVFVAIVVHCLRGIDTLCIV